LKKDVTVFFTFVCESTIRREYIKIAIKTLFKECESIDTAVIIVDGSSEKHLTENKKIFKNINSLTYIHDEHVNPFKRCYKYLKLIKTEFVLRLLEDAAFINFSKKNFFYVKKDIEILKNLSSIDAIHYLMVDDNNYSIMNNTLFYSPVNFNNKTLNYFNGHAYYSHTQNGFLYHYMCNNLLLRTNLMKKQWKYLAKYYLTHNDAEAGNINNKLYNLFSNVKYIRGIIRLFFRFYEKIFRSDCIIKSAIITETSTQCDALHIGYYRSEIDDKKFMANNNDKVLKNLLAFNKLSNLKKIKFKRYAK